MKLTLLVIALKIVELAAVVLVPYLAGRPVLWWLTEREELAHDKSWLSNWCIGCIVIALVVCLAIVSWGVYTIIIRDWLPANIAWAKRILGI